MQEHFNQEIEDLKTSLIKMASLVDEQTGKAFAALETGKIELCENIKRKDLEIDSYDNLIQIQCENILALFQPVAVDLRFVISALMINNQLERCGDIAVNIAQRVKKTRDFHNLIADSQITEMGNNARKMLSNVIDSFIHNDLQLAKQVIENDEVVDQLNKKSFKFLVAKMKENPELIEPCSHLIVLTRHIERLADHATNIAENVVFYIEAKVIAHEKKLSRFNPDSNSVES
ncbi:MAG: phosphate transport system regulatory protein PhoU [Ignavibacteriales bacterium CG_4_9_14_3_um_filter_34_10]|nr:MAG: phosphate transport system regulatory protein PhoU [Ignavibacteriales bacterium CG_4_9_14_3_um_filter_34_10]